MSDRQYAGMTVNERLFEAGLLDDFDAAVKRGDKAAVVALLERVELIPEEARDSADTLFANPERYGYARR